VKADDLRNEVNAQMLEWEQTEPRSRPEHEAAEAFTRAWAELDALMRDGREPPPAPWAPGVHGLPGTYILVLARDVGRVLERMENQVTLTPYEKAAARRLRESVDDAKERA
jgi:hypothetical protein